MSEARVPINDLSRIDPKELEVLSGICNTVISSGSYVLGQQVDKFETDFATFIGADTAISLSSGTDALIIALTALNISHGKKIATVANAGGYSTTAIHSVGLESCFIDIDPDNHLMSPSGLQTALACDPDISAVIVTHLYGNPASIEQISHICKEASVPLIEDCAQSTGLRVAGKHVGTFGDFGTFSFFPTKNLGAFGDGGAVIANDSSLAKRARALRQYGWASKYHVELWGGQNSRLDEIQAALLLHRMKFVDSDNERRRSICQIYASALRDKTTNLIWFDSGVGHLAVLDSDNKQSLFAHLEGKGVSTGIHYPVPDHRQPAWSQQYADVSLPVTDDKVDRIITIPCFPTMTDREVEQVAEALSSFVSS